MKRNSILFVVVICMLITAVACGNTSITENKVPNPTPIPTPKSSWHQGFELDEFENETDKRIIQTGTYEGEYQIDSTSLSCEMKIVVDSNSHSILKIDNLPGHIRDVSVTVLMQNGEKRIERAFIAYAEKIEFFGTINDIYEDEGKISLLIESEKGNYSWLFKDVDINGYNEAMKYIKEG